jgi:hypothetical protein
MGACPLHTLEKSIISSATTSRTGCEKSVDRFPFRIQDPPLSIISKTETLLVSILLGLSERKQIALSNKGTILPASYSNRYLSGLVSLPRVHSTLFLSRNLLPETNGHNLWSRPCPCGCQLLRVIEPYLQRLECHHLSRLLAER